MKYLHLRFRFRIGNALHKRTNKILIDALSISKLIPSLKFPLVCLDSVLCKLWNIYCMFIQFDMSMFHGERIGWLIDWCLTPTLGVFQLYRGVNTVTGNLQQKYEYTILKNTFFVYFLAMTKDTLWIFYTLILEIKFLVYTRHIVMTISFILIFRHTYRHSRISRTKKQGQ
jgi:hypothetical protein